MDCCSLFLIARHLSDVGVLFGYDGHCALLHFDVELLVEDFGEAVAKVDSEGTSPEILQCILLLAGQALPLMEALYHPAALLLLLARFLELLDIPL